jgi:hypothetical protein
MGSDLRNNLRGAGVAVIYATSNRHLILQNPAEGSFVIVIKLMTRRGSK